MRGITTGDEHFRRWNRLLTSCGNARKWQCGLATGRVPTSLIPETELPFEPRVHVIMKRTDGQDPPYALPDS